VSKHITLAWGESVEASKSHCLTAAPGMCDFYRRFAQQLYNLLSKMQGGECDESTLEEVKGLRKEFEQAQSGNGSSSCQSGSCLVSSDESDQGNISQSDDKSPHDRVEECCQMAEEHRFGSLSEQFRYIDRCIRGEVEDE